MHPEDGSPLPLGQQLRGRGEPKVLRVVHLLHRVHVHSRLVHGCVTLHALPGIRMARLSDLHAAGNHHFPTFPHLRRTFIRSIYG